MTENEAIEQLRLEVEARIWYKNPIQKKQQKFRKTISAHLLRLATYQYRLLKKSKSSALGTVEELRELVAKGRAYEQVKWELDIAIGQLKEIGCGLGQKMNEIKEAMEK